MQILPNSTIGVLALTAVAGCDRGLQDGLPGAYVSLRRILTGQIADIETCGSYEDLDAVRAFARAVHVVTFEFENVPSMMSMRRGYFLTFIRLDIS